MSAANILGFVQDIVRGVRQFRKSLDQLGQTADAKGSTNKGGENGAR